MIKKILLYITIISFVFAKNALSVENKILLKINNEIITKLDIENESRYLLALNENLRSLNEDELFEISKKSIIKEKIKLIEILNNIKDPKISEKYLKLIFKNIYQSIGLNNIDEFKKYLEYRKIDYLFVKKKIETEAIWNELIMMKFSSKLKIDNKKIRKNLIKNKKKKSKSFLLSEIIFEIKNLNELNNTYSQIKKTILEKGFDNAALKHSSSNTANMGGKIGWIDEDSLNTELKSLLLDLEKNEYTKPITVPGGFMILMINEIKIIEKDQNIDELVKKTINQKRNNQLNQFSKMYFNKVKKNMRLDEI